MSLKHAILGFLNYRPFTGYDLKTAFDTSVRHFWPADQSQIYRTLASLAAEGLAEVELVEQETRPDRKLYHITTAGQEELTSWLTVPLPPEQARSAQLIQVFFAGQLSDEQIMAGFRQMRQHLQNLLAAYGRVPEQAQVYMDMVNSPRETFFWMLTLEYGIRSHQAQLEWVESVIERLENKQHPAP